MTDFSIISSIMVEIESRDYGSFKFPNEIDEKNHNIQCLGYACLLHGLVAHFCGTIGYIMISSTHAFNCFMTHDGSQRIYVDSTKQGTKKTATQKYIAALEDRAVQYLTGGIPPEMQGGGAMETEEGGGDDEGGDEGGSWEELAASPAFLAEVQGLGDHAALQGYLEGLRTSNPAQLALLQGNAQAFTALLNATQAAAQAGGGTPPAAPALPFGGGGGGGLSADE